MDADLVFDFVRLLYSARWNWRVEDIQSIALQLGLSSRERTKARATFEFPSGPTCSFYYSGEHIRFVESTLDVFYGPEQLSPDALHAKEQDFLANYHSLLNLTTKEFVPPSFEGPYGSHGFPESQAAIRLAVWTIDNAVLMIEYKHEDRELPIRLCVDVYPHL